MALDRCARPAWTRRRRLARRPAGRPSPRLVLRPPSPRLVLWPL